MRLHYIQDQLNEKNINIKWQPGDTNLADYFTKHFVPSHHNKH